MKKRYNKKNKKKKNNSVDIIIQNILDQLEKGIIPWERPWDGSGKSKNLVSKKSYRGFNQVILSCQPFSSPWWATFKQITDKGGKVKKGSKGTAVALFKFFTVEEEVPADKRTEDGPEKVEKTRCMVKHFTVFNLEQTEGIEAPSEKEEREIKNNEKADEIIKNYLENGPSLKHGGDKAYYMPSKDHVQLPPRVTFKNDEEYYGTTFHELIHSTGHKKRLSRKEITGVDCLPVFGSEDYSKEELVAEIGAWILCGECGFEAKTQKNTIAYCQGWLKKLKNDKKLLLVAGARAEKAANYLLKGTETEEDVSEVMIVD